MDLSRRKFLGMLGLAPVIPVIAPKKIYVFFGKILRTPAPRFMSYITHLSINGETVFSPEITGGMPLVVDQMINVPEIAKLLHIHIPNDKDYSYGLQWSTVALATSDGEPIHNPSVVHAFQRHYGVDSADKLWLSTLPHPIF